MRIGVIGRTKVLYDSIVLLLNKNYQISFIYTCKEEEFYDFPAKKFKEIAKKYSIPFFEGLNIEQNIENIKLTKTDVCISLNWLTILKSDFLSLFKHGVLNCHSGDLPRYRGNACVNWAIINQEKSACITIHKMNEYLDDGPIFLKKYYDLDQNTYIGDFYKWSSKEVPNMFLETIQLISNGYKPEDQSTKIKPIRCYPRKPSDSKINWNNSVDVVHALVRASSSPFLGAYCFTEQNIKLIILRSKILEVEFDFYAIPGQICDHLNNYPLVACNDKNKMLMLEKFFLEGSSFEESKLKLTSSKRARLI